MAVDLGAVANRLFDTFLAPLVLGGEMKPGRPIGARAALAMGKERVLTDIDLCAHVELVRTRVARKLVPVDRVEGLSEAEWALGAALHDLVQAAHPGFDVAFRRSGPQRLLELVNLTLERVPGPTSVRESLSRHTWFGRIFEMERVDTTVKWWVGSSTFLGESPPPRLSAWPELRRVHVEKSPRRIMDLPESGSAVDASAFAAALTAFLVKTPLTDLASCHRSSPEFAWSSESLGLVASAPGRALVLRALGEAPKSAVDASLGRATRSLIQGRAWKPVGVALDLLAERALVDAALVGNKGELPPPKDAADAATYARCIGALVACEQLRADGSLFSPMDRADLLARLAPIATSPVAGAFATELTLAHAGPIPAALSAGPTGEGV
jgi:hypothetical protein